MKNPITPTTFICQLPQTIQDEIKADLLSSYDMDFADYDDTLEESISIAMNGRLSDLSDTLDINKYLS